MFFGQGTYDPKNLSIREGLIESAALSLVKRNQVTLAIDLVFIIDFEKWMRKGVNYLKFSAKNKLNPLKQKQLI